MTLAEFLNDFYNEPEDEPNDWIIISDEPYTNEHLISSLILGREDSIIKEMPEYLLARKFNDLKLIGETRNGYNIWYIQVGR